MAITAALIVLVATCIAAGALARTYRLLISDRSFGWRIIVTVIGLGYGVAPALHGRPEGVALAAIGTAAAVSVFGTVARRWPSWRASPSRRPDDNQHQATAARPGAGEPTTELERAEDLQRRLLAYVARLEQSAAEGDTGAQAALAREVTALATELHETIDVVFAERSQLAGRNPNA